MYFTSSYIIVSMILNTYELSASYFSHATGIFVVDGCQFGPSWIFGLKLELMTCADLLAVQQSEAVFFRPYMIVSML